MTIPSLFTAKIEVEWTAGTWTDVTTYHTVEYNPLIMHGGRATEFDLVSPGSAIFDLQNIDGRFTPDNASGAYFPNVVENKRVRISLIKSGVTYQIGVYYAQAWEPNFQIGDINDSICTVTAYDSLSVLANQIMIGQLGQAALALATANSTWCDYFTCTPSAYASLNTVTNIPAVTPSTGIVHADPSYPGAGPIAWSSDAKIATDGTIAIAPKQINTANAYLDGEFLVITPRSGVKAMEMLVNLDGLASYFTDGASNGFYPIILALYNSTTISHASTILGYMACLGGYFQWSGVTNVTPQAPGQWHKLSLVASGSTTNLYFDDVLIGNYAINFASLVTILIGMDTTFDGAWTGGSPTSYSNGCAAHVSGIALYGGSLKTSVNQSMVTGTGLTVATQLTAMETQLNGFAPGFTTVGSDSGRSVITGQTSGVSALTALQNVMNGNNGLVWARYDGTVLLLHPDALYPQTSLCTFDSEGDSANSSAGGGGGGGSASLSMKRSLDVRPTRVTVTSPAISVTAIDTAAEALGIQKPLNVNTTNANQADALSVGWAYMSVNNALRITSFIVDLVTASTDWTSTLFSTSGTTGALFPTQRATINVPSAVIGVSSKDVFLQGWTITLTEDEATIAFDCSPATKATVTGGTCVGNTSTGTVIITTDRVWTTVAQAYPMDLDWAGERITVSAPGGGSSPQTFTVTARGVTGGTGATSHSSGTKVDQWHCAAS